MTPASPSTAPILETPRLRLRAHRLEDFPASAALWANPVTTRYIGGTPSTRQRSWSRLLVHLGHWSLLGFGYWAVEERSSGRFVGELGFADLKRNIEPSIEGWPELGWVIVPEDHGKGYATEALRAAIAWGDTRFGRTRTVCLIDPRNLASLRVAEKCGYRELQRTTYEGEPSILLYRDVP